MPLPNEWQELQSLVDQVLDAAPDQRAALIDRLSGGATARRAALERLVAARERDHRLLDRPPAERFVGLVGDEGAHLPELLAERYRITRELGRGGMAIVYLARDVRHGRDVAVKVVRPELAAALGPARFLREIEIAAKLHHPHIVSLYDSGEADGVVYYVMPYEDGVSLRQKLTRDVELPIPDAVRILRDVADALAYAHQQGVVHRDIKPENVMLGGRHAMVTDFGVAKAVSDATDRQALTTAGVALGTPAYMAPEQIAADPRVDHRADIYAFGAMAYELLCGQPPFVRPTAQGVLGAHVTEAAEPVTHHRATVPDLLAALVMKCLEKKPADRWQNADELLRQIETVATASAPPTAIAAPRARWRLPATVGAAVLAAVALGITTWQFNNTTADSAKTIAVLPFRNLSGNPEDRYFTDGVHEEILTKLTRIGSLRVISRTSVMEYRETTKNLRTIAAELGGVRYILEGSVSRFANQVSITAQLIDANSDAHLWAETYERPSDNLFAIRTDVAQRIAATLRAELSPQERAAMASTPTTSSEAYDYYLRANDYYNAGRAAPSRSEGARLFTLAIEMYNRAVTADERFALAYARLAIAHLRYFWLGHDRSAERVVKARDAIDQAVRHDPNLPDAQFALGYYHYWGKLDYKAGLIAYERAQQLGMQGGDLAGAIGAVQRRLGRFDEAVASLARAAELDPRFAPFLSETANTLMALRRYDEAERYLNRALQIAPDASSAQGYLAWLHLMRNADMEKARAVLAPALRLHDAGAVRLDYRINLLARDYRGALRSLDSLPDGEGSHYLHGFAYHLLGDTARARRYFEAARVPLERKVAQGDSLGITSTGLFPGPLAELSRVRARLGNNIAALGGAKWLVDRRAADAFAGPQDLELLAEVQATVGQYDAAIDIIQDLLLRSYEYPITLALLRIDPVWDPLRIHPRFRRLLGG